MFFLEEADHGSRLVHFFFHTSETAHFRYDDEIVSVAEFIFPVMLATHYYVYFILIKSCKKKWWIRTFETTFM